MSYRNNIIAIIAAGLLVIAALTVSIPAYSSDVGAFIGGVAAARIGQNMRRRTAAEEQQAYNSQQQVQQQQAAPAPTEQTPQQKIQQLDQLAAGGYITPEEYKTKKKAILDSM